MVKPIRIALAALLLTVLAAGSARADATYHLALQGIDQRTYPPCRLVDQAPPCNQTVLLPWTGTLDIVTFASADGVYSDDEVLAFDFLTNAGISLSLTSLPGGSVTVADGRVSSLEFLSFLDNPGDDVFFRGLVATYSRSFDAPHLGIDFAIGQLTAVPEPGTATLTLLALACIGAAVARSRRATS